jgi:hypothetical protein
MPKVEEVDEQQPTLPPVQPDTPTPTVSELPLVPQTPEPQIPASKSDDERSDEPNAPRHGDGWYVAYRAILPGTYYGV